ncbi:MAG TPA: hypothetical protein VFC39_08250 [Acidobacteriaceae bacterium]|nr:hypothetical protein [Acidobacteriaceae bacterium]
MPSYTDSLRGYAAKVLARDGHRCRFCGLDGTASFDNWLALSWDHLLPKGHPHRDNPEFIVAACNFCNTADNRYLEKVVALGYSFDGKSPDELIARRLVEVQKTRDAYRRFWEENVAPQGHARRQE